MMAIENEGIRNGVVELVYDASAYEEICALSFDVYQGDCSQHERNLRYAQSTPPEERYVALLSRAGMSSSALREEQWRHSQVELEEEPFDFDDVVVSRGYANYVERFKDQTRIVEDRFHVSTLNIIFQRFPRLRRIVFTDFRALALHGEGYNDLCDRLFGLSMEHSGLAHYDEPYTNDLCSLLEVAAMVPGERIRELRIASHPFERNDACVRRDDLLSHPGTQKTPSHAATAFPIDAVHFDPRVRCALPGLNNLTLQIAFSNEFTSRPMTPDRRLSAEQSLVCGLLMSCTASLTRLSLTAMDLLQCRPEGIGSKWLNGRICLEALLFPLTFPSLRRLDLRGWPLPENEECERFLSRHADQLRALKLQDCYVTEDPYGLARRAGAHLSIDSVLIKLYVSYDESWQSCHDDEVEKLWLNGRPNERFVDEP